MCGIAGASLNPNYSGNARRIAKAMLLSIEERGRDATGIAFRAPLGEIQVHKTDLPAATFVKHRLSLPRHQRTFIMHTRWATQGSPLLNENNHPIANGTVVGVHNGHISNDDELFLDLDKTILGKRSETHTLRMAEVDSEAVFALLGWNHEADVTKLLPKVRGGAAIAYLDNQDEYDVLHLARLNTSPLVVCHTKCGSILFASTREAIFAGLRAGRMESELISYVSEGTYLEVLDGKILSRETFVPARSAYTSYTRRGSSMSWEEWDDFDTYQSRSFDTGGQRPLHVVGTLDDRLAAEVPDIGSPEDEARREAYKQWWELNTQSLDDALEHDDARDGVVKDGDGFGNGGVESPMRERFAAFCEAPRLNSYLLSHIDYATPRPDAETYLSDNRHVIREAAIEEWLTCIDGENADLKAHNRAKALEFLKGDIRPSDPVTTHIAGEKYFGHVITLPTSFPAGDYILRVYVPNKKRKGGYESTFVARGYFEFERATLTPSQRAVKEEANAVR